MMAGSVQYELWDARRFADGMRLFWVIAAITALFQLLVFGQ